MSASRKESQALSVELRDAVYGPADDHGLQTLSNLDKGSGAGKRWRWALGATLLWSACALAGAVGTELTTSANPSSYGTNVTFTATVTGDAPTGTVSFFHQSGETLGGCVDVTLNSGTALCTINMLPIGPHEFSAVYSGDGNNPGGASNVLSQVVGRATSAVTLAAAGNPVSQGYNVSFTATVYGQLPGGTVAFMDGASPIPGCAASSLNSGSAMCSTNGLALGTHQLTAVYSGDASNAGSSSNIVAEVVNALGSTVELYAYGPVNRGEEITVWVVVPAANGMVTGSVLVEGAGASCGATLVNGNGQCVLVPTIAGEDQPLDGKYGGDWAHPAGTGSTLLTVLPTMDIDANGTADALSDGLLLVRYMFGLRGGALINGAIGQGATRSNPDEIAAYLDQFVDMMDVDGDGVANPLTDGVLLVRYLFGLRDATLIVGAISNGASRSSSVDIENYIVTLVK